MITTGIEFQAHTEQVPGSRQGSNGSVCFYCLGSHVNQGAKSGLERESRKYPGSSGGLQMKMLIFLIVLAAVVTVVLLKVRKADAEKDLARQKAMKKKQQQRKETITAEDQEWPVIIKAAGKSVEEDEETLPEPTMTAIKFKPVDHPGIQH